MLARRISAFAVLAAFIALAVLSFLGDRVLSAVFIVVAAAVLGHHALRLCPGCSNRACPFNPRFDHAMGVSGGEHRPYSDLRINRTTVAPLLLTGPLAVLASWRFSPYWTLAWAAATLASHTVFRELTCKHCGNDCAGNCNAEYRRWKRAP